MKSLGASMGRGIMILKWEDGLPRIQYCLMVGIRICLDMVLQSI